MARPPRYRVVFNADKMLADMATRGWIAADLAREADVSEASVSRFLSGRYQSPRIAKRLAMALGYQVKRYLLPTAKQALAS
jgi:transcriptional regulator with XRE-family HTH domain